MRACGLRHGIAGLLLGLADAVAAVVPPTGVRPASAQSAGEFFDYPQTLLNGAISATISVPLESCRKLCVARTGCVGFDHSSSDGLCRLFSSVDGADESLPHIAGTRSVVTGYRPPANPPVQSPSPKPAEAEAPKPWDAPSPKPAEAPKSARKNGVRKSAPPAVAPKPKPPAAAPSSSQRRKPAAKQGGRFKMCTTVRGVFQVPVDEVCSPGM
ncbi:PAN domain-containing protein [Mesorhizobium amorphae]|uniref:PAN domain-containing protein n=1 Tax=Mesorhizobium amorphae TaxID=71433 RepID=UPI0024E0FE9D|nr:PAN domain-containing protein [Mesorhizobium amorphae]